MSSEALAATAPIASSGSLRAAGAAIEEPAIVCRDLGKCYHIYGKPSQRLTQALLRWTGKRFYREFWAARHVTLEVKRGEAIGILGRNGAGKSTLLQMIAGTMTPTEGEVAVRGRVAAMLELGSGFNTEFTGRENIFLGGSILGISRREMESRFDEIAAFADIGAFLDQPMKTYSSGMFARVAFAVAFALEPEIMIVDEILAVGDVGFQHKCLARLRKLRESGMTLLFVSHSADAVRNICQRAIIMANGQIIDAGPSDSVVDRYLALMRQDLNERTLREGPDLGPPRELTTNVPATLRYGSGQVQLEKVEVLDEHGQPCAAFKLLQQVCLRVTIVSHVDTRDLSVCFLVRDMHGVDVMGTTTFDERHELPAMKAGERLTVEFKFSNHLRQGSYGIVAAINRVTQRDMSDVVLLDQADHCASFAVMWEPSRPVWYKYFEPVEIVVNPTGR